MAHLKANKRANRWEARWRTNGKEVYKSTQIPIQTGDPERDRKNKAHAKEIAEVFHAAAKRERIKKELHRALDEIIDRAL